jgi:uncharacterized cupin superfamily protein
MKPEAVFSNLEQLRAQLSPDEPIRNADSGSPETFYAGLVDTDQFQTGIWTCTAGGWPVDSAPVDEVMVMLKGKLRITDSEGKATELSVGDIFYIPKGWVGRWDVLEDMEKIYFILP